MPYRRPLPPGFRRRYLEAHAFELLIAVMALIAAATFFIRPEDLQQSALGQSLHPYDVIWNAGYALGAVCVIAGLLWPKPRAEVIGLVLLATAVTISAVAIWQLAGTIGASAILTYVAIVLACGVRIRLIFQGSRARA